MGRARAAGVVLLALVVVGCTPSSSEPPNPTLTPALPTPSESEIERQQRLDFEAAEKSYREFRAEYNQVLARGGSGSATSGMRKTAAGPYLKEFEEVVQAYKTLNYKQQGTEKVVYVHSGLHGTDTLTMNVCEDGSDLVTREPDGSVYGRGEVRVSELTVKRLNGLWKVWTGTGQKVTTCK